MHGMDGMGWNRMRCVEWDAWDGIHGKNAWDGWDGMHGYVAWDGSDGMHRMTCMGWIGRMQWD